MECGHLKWSLNCCVKYQSLLFVCYHLKGRGRDRQANRERKRGQEGERIFFHSLPEYPPQLQLGQATGKSGTSFGLPGGKLEPAAPRECTGGELAGTHRTDLILRTPGWEVGSPAGAYPATTPNTEVCFLWLPQCNLFATRQDCLCHRNQTGLRPPSAPGSKSSHVT